MGGERMSRGAFGSFFGGTMGVLFALVFFFVGLPVLFCGGCFGLAIIGASRMPDEPNNSTRPITSQAAAPDPSETGESPPSAETATTVDPPAKTESEDSKPKSKSYAMKETVHVGYTTYAACALGGRTCSARNEFLNQPPNASYLFIELTVRNNDKKARLVPPFKLIDENGAEYEASSHGWAVEGSIGLLQSLNPSVSK